MKKRIVTILLDPNDLEAIDKLANEMPVSRSNYVQIIIRKYLKEIGYDFN
jgi:metal-responsive CopG/Arc/MetJ family transcriptional regulator